MNHNEYLWALAKIASDEDYPPACCYAIGLLLKNTWRPGLPVDWNVIKEALAAREAGKEDANGEGNA